MTHDMIIEFNVDWEADSLVQHTWLKTKKYIKKKLQQTNANTL